MANKTDVLCGIDRYPSSELYGKLVAPIIFLWFRPALIRRTVVAVAEHGTKCKIVASVLIEDVRFFKIEPERGEWVGKLRRLRGKLQRKKPAGWVSKHFLKGWGVV